MLRRLERELNELPAAHSGRTVERIERDADRDRWLTPDGTREYGFVDHVVARATALPAADAPLTGSRRHSAAPAPFPRPTSWAGLGG